MNQAPEKLKLRRARRRSRPIVAALIAVAILIVGIAASVAIYLATSVKPPEVDLNPPGGEQKDEDGNVINPLPPELSTASRKKGVYSFLVVGLDNPTNSRNTDVIMLCNFDTNTGEVNILQIPRDSYVKDAVMPSGGKINNLFNSACFDYQQKNPTSGEEEQYNYAMNYLCRKVSSLFAVPVDFYVSFNTFMYRELLELVCPITVNVPFDMDYDDPTQDLHIHLKAGLQQLDPEQAEGFSRFRQNNDGSGLAEGDFSRVDLQKIVLAAIAEKFFTETSLPSVHAVVGKLLENVNTSLSLENCVWFMTKALSLYADGTMAFSDIRMYDLPCKVPSPSQCMELLGVNYLISYGFMETSFGYTLEILNKAFNLTDVEITEGMLGYQEYVNMGGYCDHSDTEGHSIQEILTEPPKVSVY
ncbi:MAG: LCP family protein [Clostridia bacterium]|nr:LCP family protein [Clostridia bacterium]